MANAKRSGMRHQLPDFFDRLELCTIALEARTGAFFRTRRIEAFGHRVKIISPQYVKPGLLLIGRPSDSPKQDVNPPIAQTHAGLANFLDPLFPNSLAGQTGFVSVGLSIGQDHRTGTAAISLSHYTVSHHSPRSSDSTYSFIEYEQIIEVAVNEVKPPVI